MTWAGKKERARLKAFACNPPREVETEANFFV
jgi:hypothetical protein